MKFWIMTLLSSLFFSPIFAGTSAEYIRVHAENLTPKSMLSTTSSKLAKSRILLLGDFHGTNEIPDAVFLILKKLSMDGKISVGLEFPINLNKDVSRFMKTGDESILKKIKFFTDPSYHSGKGTLAMINLLQRLRTIKNIEVFCFDLPVGDKTPSQTRDSELAKNVLQTVKSNGGRKVVIYTGNVHSRLTKGVPWDPNYPTMGSELIRLLDLDDKIASIASVLFKVGQGSAFNCEMNNGKEECAAHLITKSKSPYFTEISSDFFLQEPEITNGHNYTWIIHKASASLPFH